MENGLKKILVTQIISHLIIKYFTKINGIPEA